MSEVASGCRVGSVLADRYELVRRLARGGMGEVFEGRDHQLDRRVAVKVFRSSPASDRARFDAEVLMLASLSHPGLVQVYDAGEHGGDAYVVLELVEGPTLADRLATDGPSPAPVVADLGAQLADALAYVHEHGIVHRDVSPSNVLCDVDGGRPRLADFGIARLVDTTRVTAPSTALGTAAYMAPEQVQGRDVGPGADVYALGLVLLEALTGARAFDGPPAEATIARLAEDPSIPSATPGAWRRLIEDMTRRVGAERPSAAAVRDRLRALEGGAAEATMATPAVAVPTASGSASEVTEVDVVAARSGDTLALPVGLQPTAPAPARRRRLALWAMVGAVVAMVLIGGWLAGGDEPTRVDTPPTSTTPTTTVDPAASTSTSAEEGDEAPGKGKPSGEKGEKGEKGKAKGHR